MLPRLLFITWTRASTSTRLILGNAGLAIAQVAKRSIPRRRPLHHVDYECYRLRVRVSGAAINYTRHSRCFCDTGRKSWASAPCLVAKEDLKGA
jgi:hypothetical protein